jgi:hypothetical protein
VLLAAGGSFRVFLNGLIYKWMKPTANKAIPGGGQLVLGQAAELGKGGYDATYAFVGDIAGVNIWDRVLHLGEIQELEMDCKMIYCGNVVEWADFRSGTRGFVKLRWPSLIAGLP